MVLKVTAKGVKITWKGLVSMGAGLFLLGMLVAWSGFINIGATTGHWSVTDWFLHWAMRNSVRAQSALTVNVPDKTAIVSAAGHYAATCALCHGAPGERPSPVMQATLQPPWISLSTQRNGPTNSALLDNQAWGEIHADAGLARAGARRRGGPDGGLREGAAPHVSGSLS